MDSNTNYQDELINRGKPKQQKSKLSIKYTESSFESNTFHTQMNEDNIAMHIVKMKNSLFVWLGKASHPTFQDLSYALLDRSEDVIATKIVGPPLNTASLNIANRLSKRLGKPVYVSYNLPADLMSVPFLERWISESLKKQEHAF